jgi:hypothetical protein
MVNRDQSSFWNWPIMLLVVTTKMRFPLPRLISSPRSDDLADRLRTDHALQELLRGPQGQQGIPGPKGEPGPRGPATKARRNSK